MKRKILRWVARGTLLFLSFCGIATIITNATKPSIIIDSQTLQVAWVFGIGGLVVILLTIIPKILDKVKSGKDGEG